MSTKLLLVSPLCNRDDIGESRCAYDFVRRLGERYDVTLLTYHKRSREPVSRQLPGMRVVEWAEPAGLGRAERFNSMLKPAYVPFYLRAKRWIRSALAAGERFDLAHQIAPLTLRYPSPLSAFDIPYLIGPVGGSLGDPPGFEVEDTSAWYVRLRQLDAWRLQHDPVLRRTYARARLVLGIAPYVEDLLDGIGVQRFEVMSDTGLDGLPAPVDRSGRGGPVQLLYVGRLVRTKGARDLIRAMSRLRDLPVRLTIAGDGFDRAACEQLIAELGLRDTVSLLGRVPHAQVADLYRAADVFVFPSYREPGGIVVTEAMSFGLPLVVSDRGGPGYTVDADSGIRVPIRGGPEEYADDVAAAVRRLVCAPDLRASMGAAARARISDVALWDRKIERLQMLYDEVLARAGR